MAKIDYSISSASTLVSENTSSLNFAITRSGDLAAETVYVSTTFTEGFDNDNDYKGILNKAVSFGVGVASADVTVEIVNDTLQEKNETFGLIVQKNSNDSASTYLAKSRFTITDDDNSTNLVSSETEKTTDYSISPASTSVSENTSSLNFAITRSGDLAAEIVYVSTTFTEGFDNDNDYKGILNKAVSFGAGVVSADVTVEIVNDTLHEKNEIFGLIVQKNAKESASTYLVKSRFTITDDDNGTNPAPKPDKTIAPTNPKTGTVDSNPDGNVSSSIARWRAEKSKSSESVKSKLPVTDDDNSSNPGQETTKDNIFVAAVNLSERAYSGNDDINARIQGWKPLEAADLGFPDAAAPSDQRFVKAEFSTAESTDSFISTGNFRKVGNGDGDLLRYDYKNASATVGLTILDGKRTLGIAFEGTNLTLSVNTVREILQDFFYIEAYYNSLKGIDAVNSSITSNKNNFIQSIDKYIDDKKNGIEQVLVTGHSLGGAAAQHFMHEYGQDDARFIGVTFGSPGTYLSQSVPKDRFVNIQQNGDPVVHAPQYFVKGSVINIDVEDTGLQFNPFDEHRLFSMDSDPKGSYRKTVEFITSQLDAKTLFQDMNIVAGTNGGDNLYTRTGKNGEVLLGGNGNDTLEGGITGGQGTQIFKGGLGNDNIDGDGGIDYAIYSGGRSTFTLQPDLDDQWIVTDQRAAPGSDGTDKLTSIERIIFIDSALALDVDGSAGKVAKLIGAVFGAESLSNEGYVASGLYSLDHGTSYEDLAAESIASTDAKTSEQVISLLWKNVMGSTPATEDIQPYIDKLNSGTSIGELGILFADDNKNEINIDLVGLQEKGIIFDPLVYFG
ncbi:MAG: hypothetical protein NMNS01_30090 [Nitrosomonas sp.]|nr:MAG: hypothetical protein NMNS01_30090 [Nitrosomonas sp.]